jgi:hypothetical protein
MEITAGQFRGLALRCPDLVEHVTSLVAERRTGLEDARAAVAAGTAPAAERRTLRERVRRFLRLP